jgi:hypothetical protein
LSPYPETAGRPALPVDGTTAAVPMTRWILIGSGPYERGLPMLSVSMR